jgi:hypothetical protein
MGAPDEPQGFVRLQAGELEVYLSRDIWDGIRPGQEKLLLAVSGYGRFWLYIGPGAERFRAAEHGTVEG